MAAGFGRGIVLAMKQIIATLAIVAGLLLPAFVPDFAPARAADQQFQPRIGQSRALPFARSERAQSVWMSGACWSECEAYCAWGAAGCLERDPQGQCLKLTDTCDRYCQRSCRTAGGPLLALDF